MRWRRTTNQSGVAVSATPETNTMSPAIAGAADAPARGRRTPRSARAVAAAAAAPTEAAGDLPTWDWRGQRIAYTRRGSGALPVLLVHGPDLGASSFEWRRIADALAAEHVVYTIDLLGFGASARPRTTYTARLHQSLIADFVAHVIGEPTVLVASGRAAAYAIALAARDPARFPALIAVGPTGLARDEVEREPFLVGRAAGLPLVGALLYRLRVSRTRVRRWLERTYADDDLVTDALVQTYHGDAHRPGARFVAASLAAGRLDLDVRSAMRRLTQPMLLVWGARAVRVPADASLGFRALKPGADVVLIDVAGDLPHDERPAEFLRAALDFLARVRRDHERRKPKLTLQTA